VAGGRRPVQPLALGAQRHHLGSDRLVVAGAAAGTARDPGAKSLFAQVAPRGELQEWLDARARSGDGVLAGKPALLGCRPRRRAHEIRKTGEVVFAVEHQRIALLVRQYVLAEGCAERGEALVDVGEPRLRRGGKRSAGAGEFSVITREHAPPLGPRGQPP